MKKTGPKGASKATTQITVRMPDDVLEEIDRLAEEHHRDRSGEVIHACALYVKAFKQEDKPGWVKVEEGWFK